MKRTKVKRWRLLLVASQLMLSAQATGSQETRSSVRGFVRSFYDWYVALALGDHDDPAWSIAVTERAPALSKELARGLRQDLDAQAGVKGVSIGLDFDPFLASQDPCEHYEVGMITKTVRSYWIDIVSVCDGKKAERPDVVGEVVRKGGTWMFVNFHYPKVRSDLRTELRNLREQRQKRRP